MQCHQAVPFRRVAIVLLVEGLTALQALSGAPPHRVILKVTNPIADPRPEEILEIPLSAIQTRLPGVSVERLQVENLGNHQSLPVQPDSATPGAAPDRLLVLVSLAPRETIRLAISSSDAQGNAKPLVFGRVVPERKDDFAWENDKVAYRVYGPALQATGEITSGIDVWSKRVPALVINEWYARDAEGQRTHNPMSSYHKENAQGLDSYDVGPTRGCGGTGVLIGDQLFVSKNYVSAEVLAAGPIRFRFRLRYAAWKAGDFEVSEERIITLDAGSHLNSIESTFSFAGVKNHPDLPKWAAGLAMHPGAHRGFVEDGILSVWEPLTDPAAGMDGTAIVLEPGRKATPTVTSNNAFLLLPAQSGQPIVYYAGAAWSKADIPDEVAWVRYLSAFRARIGHPLETHWESIR